VADLTLVAIGSLAILALNPAGLSTRMCLVIPMGFIAKSLPHTPGGDGLGLGDTASNAPVRALEGPGCGNSTQVCAVEGLIVLCVRKELCLDRGRL
jgi:hypothetical protein